jgi:beta-lactam-binding protein with PASTA domain
MSEENEGPGPADGDPGAERPVAAGSERPAGPAAPAPAEVSVPIGAAPSEPVTVPVEPQGEPAALVEPVRPRPHRLRGTTLLLALAVGAFGTGLFVFNNLVMPRLIHGGGQVAVPDLANMTLEQAERALRPHSLQVSRAGERFDPSVPSGFVLSQDPPPGTPVRGGRRVMVVVSLGEEFSSVPELFGESLRGARLLIERAGLRVGGITRAPSEDVGEGLVAGSDPPAESVLPRDTPVALLVSTGAGEESFVMPDVLGREIGGVRRQLESMGFRVFTPPAAPSVGAIVSQVPGVGSRITINTTIVLQATGRIIR